MRSVGALIEICRQNGLPITQQRRAIVELLVEHESHPRAAEVYERSVPAMPDISLTTVYTTLRELVASGELALVRGLGVGEMRYDTNNCSHHHL